MIEKFARLFTAFETNGNALFIVGGAVRDSLLGLEPKDVDFCTDALPTQTKRILKAMGLPVIPVGEEHGTIATVMDGEQVEITTFRLDTYTGDSRKPEVTFSKNIEDDLCRRDLTINSMAMGRDGTIIDPFGGRIDIYLKALRVPVPHGKDEIEWTNFIFNQDALRILRAARFMSKLGFTPSDKLTEGVKACCHLLGRTPEGTTIPTRPLEWTQDGGGWSAGPSQEKELLDQGQRFVVSRERLGGEWEKLLLGKHVVKAFRWMADTGLLAEVCPEFLALRDLQVDEKHEGKDVRTNKEGATQKDQFEHVLKVIENSPVEPLARWAAFAHDLGKPPTLEVIRVKTGSNPTKAGVFIGGEAAHRFAEKLADKISKKDTDLQDLVELLRSANVAPDLFRVAFTGHDHVGVPVWNEVARRFRLSGELRERVAKLVVCHLRPGFMESDVTDGALRRLVRDVGEENWEALLVLSEADVTSADSRKRDQARKKIDGFRKRVLAMKEGEALIPKLPKGLGFKIAQAFDLDLKQEGQVIGEKMDSLKEAILDGTLEGSADITDAPRFIDFLKAG